MIDYYKVLNLSKNCTTLEIKIAYRKLALVWHPDKNPSANAQERFIEIHEAYEILIDPLKRNLFDSIFINDSIEILKNSNSGKNDKFTNFQTEANRKAKYYSNLTYKKFLDSFLDLIINVASKSAKGSANIFSIGCGGWLIFCGIGAFVRTFEFENKHDWYWFLLLPVLGAVFLTLGILLLKGTFASDK